MSRESYVEPIFYHDGVTGWHHHHTAAGAVVHLTEASGHDIDSDGATVIWSAHGADHESTDGHDVCADSDCSFAGLVPEREET